MTLAAIILALVTAQRLWELWLARRNTWRLKRAGAYEVGAEHYPLVIAVHAAWLAGLWLQAPTQPVHMVWLGVFIVLQGLRLWVISTLGWRWTTRIIVLPGAPLVRKGPYRFVSHPNYMVVAAEIAVLPLAFGLGLFALVFTLLNAAVLTIRISAEARALSGVRAAPGRLPAACPPPRRARA